MATDDRILPPNFSAMYGLQSIGGYDPLYLQRYGELIAASERGEPNISPPFGFNRIISPHRFDSKIIDLIGVKYVLSLSDLNSSKLTKVFQERETRVYENINVFPRAFFVEDIYWAQNKQDAIEQMFKTDTDLTKTAILEKPMPGGWDLRCPCSIGKVSVVSYSNNKVILITKNKEPGFLVFIDSYYPTWKIVLKTEDSLEERMPSIFITDFQFRGVVVPKGNNTVTFYNTPL